VFWHTLDRCNGRIPFRLTGFSAEGSGGYLATRVRQVSSRHLLSICHRDSLETPSWPFERNYIIYGENGQEDVMHGNIPIILTKFEFL
jgi:hypothetical protein